jgi:hypothetical protein
MMVFEVDVPRLEVMEFSLPSSLTRPVVLYTKHIKRGVVNNSGVFSKPQAAIFTVGVAAKRFFEILCENTFVNLFYQTVCAKGKRIGQFARVGI